MPKKPPADPQSCESCRFFLANQTDQFGYCRRLPPVIVIINDEAFSEQPTTSAPDWGAGKGKRIEDPVHP